MSIRTNEMNIPLDINQKIYKPELIVDGHIGVWHRILELASLVRTFDSSIPENIACLKIADTEDPLDTPFEIYFTDSKSKVFDKEALDESNSIPFFDVIQSILPDYILEEELAIVTLGSTLNFKNTTDAAIYMAFKDMEIKIASFKDFIEDENGDSIAVKQVSTNVIKIQPEYYKNNVAFSNIAFLNTDYKDEANEFPSLNKSRDAIKNIKTMVRKPFSMVTEEDKQFIKDSFSVLKGRYNDNDFENIYHISFISEAMTAHKNSIEWIKFLHQDVGCSIDVNHGLDNNVNSVALAIFNNDIESLNYFIDNKFSMLNDYKGIPVVMDKTTHNIWFRSCADQVVPLLHLAAITGSSESLNLLLEKGIDPNRITERGYTAAHFAVLNEDEKSLRSLAAYGADFNREETEQRKIPSELARSNTVGDRIYQQLEDWRTEKEPRPAKHSVISPIIEKDTLNKIIPNTKDLLSNLSALSDNAQQTKKTKKIKI